MAKWLACLFLAAILAGCGGDGSRIPAGLGGDGRGPSLAFLVSPPDGAPGQPLLPAVQVEILGPDGQRLPASANLRIALEANPGGATLAGTLEVNAQDGVAVFSDLALDRPGQGYTLKATLGGANSAVSAPFDILAPLAFRGPLSLQAGSGDRRDRQGRALAAGDFDGDGRRDLAMNNPGDSTVTVQRQTSEGAFVRTDAPVDGTPGALAAGDFDGDSRDDLAVGMSGGVAILLSDGDGTFTPATPLALSGDGALAVADLDGDGRQDLLAGDSGLSAVRVFLGNGAGGFTEAASVSTGYENRSLATPDLDGDGVPDLAVAVRSDAQVRVFLGAGDGTFASSATLAQSYPEAVAAADLDGDGDVDLAVADRGNTTLAIHPGLGDGTFAAPTVRGVPQDSIGVAAADLDGDGLADLLVLASRVVQVLLNDGGLAFLPSQVDVGPQAQAMVVGPLLPGAAPDMALADQQAEAIYVYAGVTGGFETTFDLAVDGVPYSVDAGDVDGDGLADLVAPEMYGSTIKLWLQRSTGPWESEVYQVGSQAVWTSMGDMDGDGRLDLVAANRADSTVTLLLNRGVPTMEPLTVAAPDTRPFSALTPDLNGDGRLDLVITSYESDPGLYWRLNLGNDGGGLPQFGPLNSVSTGGSDPMFVATGDVDGDGDTDLAACNYESHTLTVLTNGGGADPTFTAGTPLPTGFSPGGVALADLDGDGDLDLVNANSNSDSVSVRLNAGGGVFGAPADTPTGRFPRGIEVGDLDGDGDLDVVTANSSTQSATVLVNDGAGAMARFLDYALVEGAAAVVAGHFNADTLLDFAVACGNSGRLSLLLRR